MTATGIRQALAGWCSDASMCGWRPSTGGDAQTLDSGFPHGRHAGYRWGCLSMDTSCQLGLCFSLLMFPTLHGRILQPNLLRHGGPRYILSWSLNIYIYIYSPSVTVCNPTIAWPAFAAHAALQPMRLRRHIYSFTDATSQFAEHDKGCRNAARLRAARKNAQESGIYSSLLSSR